MKNYKISVIIPVFNGEKYIKTSFNSIIEQSFPFKDLEIIFVNDHSTDKTKETLFELAHKYPNVKIYETPKGKKGPGATRNVGILKSTTPFLCFLDVDDIMHKDFIKKAYYYMNKEKVDMVKFGHSISCFGKITSLIKPHAKNRRISAKDLSALVPEYVEPWGTLYRKDLLIKNHILFNEHLPNKESICFTCEAMVNAKRDIYFVPSYDAVTWHIRATGAHASLVPIETFDEHLYACLKFLNLMYKSNQKESCIRRTFKLIVSMIGIDVLTSPSKKDDVVKYLYRMFNVQGIDLQVYKDDKK